MLIHKGYPLPSNRTLQRSLKRITFQPGILHSVMSLLHLKTLTMDASDKYCGLVMDEMSIKQALEYDVGDQVVRGYDTLQPSCEELASHALVFALIGIKNRWKQVIAYHLTGSSFRSKDVVKSLTTSLPPVTNLD
ncbi:Putative LOC755078 [Caligus rogercresseyi]|uniref:LOC755078 n=1 Tax=Caligus rogercresseyi TaxID=217165 RepID=A0A7T8GUV5_CALRO|nr:Putative LOC755078 [Caligus rogercresseyi]